VEPGVRWLVRLLPPSVSDGPFSPESADCDVSACASGGISDALDVYVLRIRSETISPTISPATPTLSTSHRRSHMAMVTSVTGTSTELTAVSAISLLSWNVVLKIPSSHRPYSRD